MEGCKISVLLLQNVHVRAKLERCSLADLTFSEAAVLKRCLQDRYHDRAEILTKVSFSSGQIESFTGSTATSMPWQVEVAAKCCRPQSP